MRARTLFGAVLAATIVLLVEPAQAQGWGMTTPSGGGLGQLPVWTMSSGDWERCTNSDRNNPLERAVESCNRLLAERPGHLGQGAIYWQRAMRYLDAGDAQRAEDDLKLAANAFSAAIEADPRDYTGYNNRGSVLTRLGQFDNALADYDHAIAIESDASSPHLGRGGILFRRGDYAGASASFDRAARIAARTAATGPRHHTTRCEVRAAARIDPDRALEFCNRAVRNSDNPSYALTSRGYYWFMQGDLVRAAADFARAIETDPYNAPALHGRGVVAVRQDRAAEGEADMARARAMDSFEVDYYANAGLTP
jgi:tetratricopeptide (TPR) repeat protein